MIVGIQFRPDRERREVELSPHGSINGRKCNEAGLLWFFQQAHDRASIGDRQADLERNACLYAPFRCPHNYVCNKEKHFSQKAAVLGSRYTSDLRPIGQMSLFAPRVTHQRVWSQPDGHDVVVSATRPYSIVWITCRDMAVAVMEYSKHQEWANYTHWKIIALDDSDEWSTQRQQQYAGKIKACVFDAF